MCDRWLCINVGVYIIGGALVGTTLLLYFLFSVRLEPGEKNWVVTLVGSAGIVLKKDKEKFIFG